MWFLGRPQACQGSPPDAGTVHTTSRAAISWQPVNLWRVQQAVDAGRLDPAERITMRELRDSGAAGKRVQHGFKLLAKARTHVVLARVVLHRGHARLSSRNQPVCVYAVASCASIRGVHTRLHPEQHILFRQHCGPYDAQGAGRLSAPLHLEVSQASAAARRAVEAAGGSVTTVYYNKLGACPPTPSLKDPVTMQIPLLVCGQRLFGLTMCSQLPDSARAMMTTSAAWPHG